MITAARLPILLLSFLSFIIHIPFSKSSNKKAAEHSLTAKFCNDSCENISDENCSIKFLSAYDIMHLKIKGLSKNVFDLALKGYENLLKKGMLFNKNVLSIIDFSKGSNQKRLYILDLKNNKILFQTFVAHGHNSGLTYANDFSNDEDSHKSSLGFYVTMLPYTGECGYALKLKGLEKGFNDNAYNRNIVMHGSDYVNKDFIRSNGFLGRSFGCPAVPREICKPIIDIIKKGSCLFIYHPTKKYLLTSPILNG